VDKQFSETYLSIDISKLKAETVNRGSVFISPKNEQETDFKRYQFTES
jgi:hypothetical protein